MTAQYIIKNSYDIRDDLKRLGGKWDAEKKGWIISAESFAKASARTQSYGMSWCKGWAKAVKEIVEA